MPLARFAPFSFERSVVPCFLYRKSTQPNGTAQSVGAQTVLLIWRSCVTKERQVFLAYAAPSWEVTKKKVAKLIRGQLSSSPPAASAQKVSVRVMEEVLVLPSCSLNEEGISAWSTTGLSITELTRPRPLGEWNPSLPVWLCSAPAEKANKHAPEICQGFCSEGSTCAKECWIPVCWEQDDAWIRHHAVLGPPVCAQGNRFFFSSFGRTVYTSPETVHSWKTEQLPQWKHIAGRWSATAVLLHSG